MTEADEYFASMQAALNVYESSCAAQNTAPWPSITTHLRQCLSERKPVVQLTVAPGTRVDSAGLRAFEDLFRRLEDCIAPTTAAQAPAPAPAVNYGHADGSNGSAAAAAAAAAAVDDSSVFDSAVVPTTSTSTSAPSSARTSIATALLGSAAELGAGSAGAAGAPTVRQLVFAKCNLDESCVVQLCEMLQYSPRSRIARLSLASNASRALQGRGCTALAELLLKHDSLISLDISQNTMDAVGVTVLARSLRRNTTLQELNVTGTGISGDMLDTLCIALSFTPALKRLFVGANKIGSNDVRHLVSLIGSTPADGKAVAQSLFEDADAILTGGSTSTESSGPAARGCHPLVHLDLRANPLRDEGLRQLCTRLTLASNLQNIVLWDCGLGSLAGNRLFELLTAPTCHIHTINVGANPLGAAGLARLADALRVNQTVIKLGLAATAMNPADAVGLAEALADNKTLARLDLSANDVGIAGLLAFGLSLKTSNFALVRLDFDVDNNPVARWQDDREATMARSLKSDIDSYGQRNYLRQLAVKRAGGSSELVSEALHAPGQKSAPTISASSKDVLEKTRAIVDETARIETAHVSAAEAALAAAAAASAAATAAAHTAEPEHAAAQEATEPSKDAPSATAPSVSQQAAARVKQAQASASSSISAFAQGLRSKISAKINQAVAVASNVAHGDGTNASAGAAHASALPATTSAVSMTSLPSFSPREPKEFAAGFETTTAADPALRKSSLPESDTVGPVQSSSASSVSSFSLVSGGSSVMSSMSVTPNSTSSPATPPTNHSSSLAAASNTTVDFDAYEKELREALDLDDDLEADNPSSGAVGGSAGAVAATDWDADLEDFLND
ncbi:hypothetical protein CAOG_04157 [Capsaspora owczarzaki ATCC 30864]|uniref:Uncharacterized protein n=1 Tax=Capsaspora owczarzaki (strain ATCC 30864) TaxID=595528 RepID=A0A0D2UE18_CAPO3|nr:hypothetical protein CAOG_04157 [Capsaspora owczarzaki ATCC 30864]KJE93356.1 hypothetical protein CAOG_004157 [Capsaspora owczarzaki ATCC 30864]|eukprot:XP_004347982.1 hypothetical protein CAOG_04157 [Capsaspora owczarzaki ATCC 30864]